MSPDLDFTTKRKPNLCALCGKDSLRHNAMTKACPLPYGGGRRGWSVFHKADVFTPKQPKARARRKG